MVIARAERNMTNIFLVSYCASCFEITAKYEK